MNLNDMNDGKLFSFGKVEFGVVPDAEFDNPTPARSHEDAVHIALCNKMDAVDALDAMRHSMVSNMSKAQYIVIRNSLEELADLLRRYEGKPLPPKPQKPYHKNGNQNTKNQKKSNSYKGGKR